MSDSSQDKATLPSGFSWDQSASAPAGGTPTAALQNPASTASQSGLPSGYQWDDNSDQPAPPPKPGYSLMDPAKALAAGAVEGAGSLISGVGSLGQMVARPIVAGVNAAAGQPVLQAPINAFKPAGDFVSSLGQKIGDTESDTAKQAEAKPILQGQLLHPSTWQLGEGATDPRALVQGAANMAGQAAPLLAGGLEAKGLELAPELAAKVASGAALDAGETATVQAAMRAAAAKTLGAGAAIGGTQGAQGSADAEQQRIMAMTPEQLSAVPGYQDRIKAGMSPDDAKADLASTSAQNVFAATLPVATAAGLAGATPMLHGAQEALAQAAGKSVLKRIGAGAAIEAPLQGTIGAAQQVASTAAANASTGENRSLSDGTLGAFGGGAAAGGLFAGVGAALTRPVPFPDAKPGSLSDAANTLHTTDQTAPEPQPAAAPAAAPAPAQQAQSSQSNRVPAAAPPWINTDTGEVGQPDKSQVVSALAEHMAAQHAATGDMRVNVQDIADAWGVPKDTVARARTAAQRSALDLIAQAERNAMNGGASSQSATDDQGGAQDQPAPAGTVRSFDDIDRDIDATHDDMSRRADEALGVAAPSQEAEGQPGADAGKPGDEASADGQGEQRPGMPLPADTPIRDDVSVGYAGGAAEDGSETFQDKRMPSTVDVDGVKVDSKEATAEHERVEHPLMNLTGPMSEADIQTIADRAGYKSLDEIPSSILDDLRAGKSLNYKDSHDYFAQPTENNLIEKKYGIDPQKYQDKLQDPIDEAREKTPGSNDVPDNLEEKPYVDMGEASLAKGIEPGEEGGKEPAAKVDNAPDKQPKEAPGPRKSTAMRDAETMKVKTADGTVTGAEHVDQLIKQGYDKLKISKKEGKLEYHLLNQDDEGPPIMARQVAYAQEATKRASQEARAAAVTDAAQATRAARDAEGVRVPTTKGEMNGRSHVDKLIRDGFDQVESIPAGTKMVHRMVNSEGEKQPIKARQLAYAEESTAKAKMERAPESESPNPVATFSTAKGSTYVMHDDGTSTRNKAFRPEHGEKEQGPQPRSQRTIFVDEAGLHSLGEFQAQGGDPVRVASLSDGRFGVQYTAGKDAGKFERRTVVKVHDQPKVGLYPVELWKDGSRVHFGNAITRVDESTSSKVEKAAAQAASSPHNDLPEPTDAQKEAGNYQKGHVSLHGLDISIENPRGSTRSGVGENGKEWSHEMSDHYGYIRRTEGSDGEQVDAYIGPHPDSEKVFVVDQVDQKTGDHDEHKVMLGYDSEAQAVKAYRSNFDEGWKVGPVHAMDMDSFKSWLKSGDTTKAFGDAAGAGEKETAPLFDRGSSFVGEHEAPLGRQEQDTRSVLDSIRDAKQDPTYKELFDQVKSFEKGKLTDAYLPKYQDLADKLSKAFGVEPVRVDFHDSRAGERGKNNGFYLPDLHVVSLNREGLKPHEALSTFFHEFGHHMVYQTLGEDLAHSPHADSLWRAYQEWSRERAPDESVTSARSSRQAFFRNLQADRNGAGGGRTLAEASAAVRNDTLAPHEFFADMIARSLYEHEGVQKMLGETTPIFQRIAQAMKMMFDMLRGYDKRITDTPEAFRQWVGEMWNRNGDADAGSANDGGPAHQPNPEPNRGGDASSPTPNKVSPGVAEGKDVKPDLGDQQVSHDRAQSIPLADTRTTPEQAEHSRAIEKVAREVTANWKGDDLPAVKVVATPEQLPEIAKRGADGKPDAGYQRARGMYDGKTIYIVASAHPDTPEGHAGVLRTMAHEAIGHYGVERIVSRELGADAWSKIESSVARLEKEGQGGKAMQSVLADVRKRYGDADPTTFARETLAVMAERGVTNVLLDRAVAAVRSFLRSVMPDLKLSGAELRQLLVKSDEYLQRGESYADRVNATQALAFSRDGWGKDFPDAITAGKPGFLSDHPDYEAAKAGDREAALRLARDTVTPEFVDKVRAAIPEGSEPIIVPVVAREAAGDNEIPRMAAEVLAHQLGLSTDTEITQASKVSRTGADAMHRIANQPEFAGKVEPGKDYVLLDDTLAQGGTLAQLKTHIEREGGNVVLATALTAKDYSRKLALDPATLDKVRGRYGAIEDWWKEQFGHGFDGLTESEARTILTYDRGQLSPDGLRNRIAAGKIPELSRLGEAAAGDRSEAEASGASGRQAEGVSNADPDKPPRVDFDKAPPDETDDSGEPMEPGKPKRAFGKASASIEAIHDQLPKLDESALQKAKDWIAGKARDFEPAALGALQLRHLLEITSDEKVLEKPAKAYANLFQRMDGERNAMTQEGAGKVQKLQQWAFERGPAGWRGKLKPEAQSLFKFLHEVTQVSVDPTDAYERLLMRDTRGEQMPWTEDARKERIKVLRDQIRGRAGDDKTKMMDEIKDLQALPARERARQLKYPELVAKWNSLSPEAKDMFQMMRDHYTEQSRQLEEAAIARIDSLDIPKQNKLAAQALIKQNFEDAKVGGVYFPLMRFGDYWISGRRAGNDGDYFFGKYETAQQAAEAEKRMKAGGFDIEATGRNDANYKAKQAPSGTFIGQLMDTLRKSKAPEAVMDDIYQMFLKSLPEMSLRKSGIHRKNVAGYTDNVPRAFASSVFHGAHQISKAKYGFQLQGTMEHMQELLDARRTTMSVNESAHADALLGELSRRHDWIMNPTNSRLASKLTSIGFIYHLAASPASAITYLLQVPQIVLPVLGAHHGWPAAMKELGRTMKDAVRTNGNIDKVLQGEELMAFKALQQQGTFQRTATHTLAGVAEGDQLKSNPAWAKVMNATAWMFHKAEVINREGTGIAAYRLARSQGQSFDQAVRYADQMTNGTHGDYSNANRARYMQGNVGKIALQFKSYSLAMSWLWGRNFHQAFKGETPEVRTVARRTLTGLMGMTGLMAGAMGLPIINALRFGSNAVHAVTGDPNEPYDFNTEFESWLDEHLGKTAGSIIAHGAVNQLGADVADRTSMSDLWFRDVDKQMEGAQEYDNYLEALAGPLGGMIKNLFVGTQQFNEGHTWRGIETMMPTAAKNAMKAMRFASEGDNTLKGDPIVPDVSTAEDLIQAMGFTPTRIADQERVNSALQNYSQTVTSRRQSLINAFAMATNAGDDDGRSDTLDQIRKFNAQYPEAPISMSSLYDSMRTRQRNAEAAQNGVQLPKRLNAQIHQQVGAMADED